MVYYSTVSNNIRLRLDTPCIATTCTGTDKQGTIAVINTLKYTRYVGNFIVTLSAPASTTLLPS